MGLENLKAVAEIAEKHDLIVITDEIYSELVYDGLEHHSIAALDGMRDRTIFLHGFSKAFAMTGWRIGYACGPAPIIDAMMKIHQYAIMCAPTMAQEAALEALLHGESDVRRMRDSYHERRDFFVEGLNRLGLKCIMPQGAFYAFPSIKSTGLTSTEFAEQLLQKERVAVVPGPAFGAGGEGFVRCCYATARKDLEEALARMERFLASL
jgi:aminotransferase